MKKRLQPIVGFLRKNFSILLISALKAFGALINVAITYLVVHHSTATDAGIFLFALSAIFICSYVARLGSDNYIVSKLSGQWTQDTRKDAATLYTGSLAFSIACTAIMGAGAWLAIPGVSAGNAVMTSACVLFFSIGQINSRVLQAQGKLKSSAFLMGVAAPLFFVAIYGVACLAGKADFDGTQLIAIYAVACLASSAIGFRKDLISRISWRDATRASHDVLPFFQTGFIAICILWGGQFWAGAILPMAQLSDIAASQRLSMPINLLLVAASIALSPRLSQHHSNGDLPAIRNLMFDAGWAMVIFGAPVFIASILFLDPLAAAFHVENKWLIAIFCLAQLANAATGNSIQLLNMTGNQSKAKRSVIFGGIVFLGGMGAASLAPSQLSISLAIAAALVAQNIAAVYFSYKIFNIIPLYRKDRR
ncbi:lipopolysaccharide biosynthesis protein [Stenotrophomonas maltophilia]|uniref:lipopolysaccharide biosynthesis protein n=1 Tax=Stenotrophomonas maltophilia TaxID=40324 RepID=UPI00166C174B|nr:hypothetical protein [Stenotrophomonas maltophilia]